MKDTNARYALVKIASMDKNAALSATALATLAVMKMNAIHRYGHKIPFVRHLLKPIYKGSAHAGLKAGIAGEKGIGSFGKATFSFLEPKTMDVYEHFYNMGRVLREKGIRPGHIHKGNIDRLDEVLGSAMGIRKNMGSAKETVDKARRVHGSVSSPKTTSPVISEAMSKLLGIHKKRAPLADKIEAPFAAILHRLRRKKAPQFINKGMKKEWSHPTAGRKSVSIERPPSSDFLKTKMGDLLFGDSITHRASRKLTQPLSTAFGRKKDPYKTLTPIFPSKTI